MPLKMRDELRFFSIKIPNFIANRIRSASTQLASVVVFEINWQTSLPSLSQLKCLFFLPALADTVYDTAKNELSYLSASRRLD